MMRKRWMLLLVVTSVATMGIAQTDEEKLAGWLKKYPEADTNKDGVLTQEEAKAFRMQLQAKK